MEEAFVRAATNGNRTRALALLEATPAIEGDAWVRLVLGRGWEGDASTPGGPLGRAPLLYVTHSCFASVELARDLLARGADPNASFANEYGEMSALYGAAGVNHDPDLTRLLLDAGADPDDGESVYHSVYAESPACLELLLDHGARTTGTNAMGAVLDNERPEHLRLLLDAGADPNEGALLAHAVRRGRGADTIRLLAERGAELDRLGGETWRGDVPLRTAYQHAVLRGRDDTAAVLAELGAATDVAAEDMAIAAVGRGERPRPGALPDVLDPDGQEVVIVAGLSGRVELVVELFGADFRGVVGGSPEGTLLHHAAWDGNAALVETLIERGADPDARSPAGFDTPLGWAALASGDAGRDHVAVAERLVTAGNAIEERMLEVAAGPLYAWLAARSG